MSDEQQLMRITIQIQEFSNGILPLRDSGNRKNSASNNTNNDYTVLRGDELLWRMFAL